MITYRERERERESRHLYVSHVIELVCRSYHLSCCHFLAKNYVNIDILNGSETSEKKQFREYVFYQELTQHNRRLVMPYISHKL